MPGILSAITAPLSARNGHAVTAIMRRTSPIWIGLYLERQPLTPGAPLALTGPAGPPVPVIRDTGTAASTRPGPPAQDRSAMWLRYAAAGLCALAAAAAAVSFTAQYRMVDATRHLPVDRGPGSRDSRTPPRWSSPAWASPWRCTAAARCAPGR